MDFSTNSARKKHIIYYTIYDGCASVAKYVCIYYAMKWLFRKQNYVWLTDSIFMDPTNSILLIFPHHPDKYEDERNSIRQNNIKYTLYISLFVNTKKYVTFYWWWWTIFGVYLHASQHMDAVEFLNMSI